MTSGGERIDHFDQLGVVDGAAADASRFAVRGGRVGGDESGALGPGEQARNALQQVLTRGPPVLQDRCRRAASADPSAAGVTTFAVGDEAFLLVPAVIASPPTVTTIGGAPPAAGAANPVSRVGAPAAAAFLGSAGSAYRVVFPAGSPTGAVVLTVVVGVGTTTANLTTTFTPT